MRDVKQFLHISEHWILQLKIKMTAKEGAVQETRCSWWCLWTWNSENLQSQNLGEFLQLADKWKKGSKQRRWKGIGKNSKQCCVRTRGKVWRKEVVRSVKHYREAGKADVWQHVIDHQGTADGSEWTVHAVWSGHKTNNKFAEELRKWYGLPWWNIKLTLQCTYSWPFLFLQ